MPGPLAPHEALELHEILRTEALGATKVKAMIPLTADADLRSLMEQSLQNKEARLQRLREFARNAAH